MAEPKKTSRVANPGKGITIEEAALVACPVFVLRADRPGHLRALIAAAGELPADDMAEALRTLRDFELHEEANR